MDLRINWFICIDRLTAKAAAANLSSKEIVMSDYPIVKTAVIQAAPVLFDRDATVVKAVG